MILETQDQFDFIKMVANRLAEKLIWFLFPSKKGNNFSEHIGGMAEILEWAEEFYSQYYEKILNWEAFKQDAENLYNAATPDDLIVAFGQEKLKKFYAQNKNHNTYFLEKYQAIMNENHNDFLAIYDNY
ncbi:MAG: hypothetical protein ABI691_21720 [Ginsengibacter sp.]